MSERLDEIYKKNAEFEKGSPYNFCDRWCERCTHEKQVRCKLYLDEFERKAACIAHGRDEDDPEMTRAVLEAQYEGLDEKLNETMEKFGIDLDDPALDEDEIDEADAVAFEDLPPEVQKRIRSMENNLLEPTAKDYADKAHAFLKKTFLGNDGVDPEFRYDFETVAWYHLFLLVKVKRALAGFHEPAEPEDMALCDAVAQFEICKKAVRESAAALRKIKDGLPGFNKQITELIALLQDIGDKIEILLDSI